MPIAKKILFVDDDPHILASFSANLRKRFEMTTAPNAAEGLKTFTASGPYAVVVSDLKMPGGDGVSFLTKIKRVAPETVCIMLTGFADVDVAMDLLNRGILFRMLTKPVEVGLLSSVLESGLEHYNLVFLRQQAEERLALANKLLEQRVEERTRELEEANKELLLEIAERIGAEKELVKAKEAAEAGNNAKNEFLANMSHEIRTPLNGVIGMLQLLRMSGLSPQQEENANIALVSAMRLTQLLANILDLSRLEGGKLPMQEGEFSLENIKKSIVDVFSLKAQSKHIELDFKIDQNTPATLIGDQTRLTQILFNLVGNAVKFTENGSVDIEVYALPVTNLTSVRLLFTVKDTGVGIKDELLHDVFEPFVQGDGGVSRRFEGVGLGLALVRRLVALMDGRLAIDSDVDQGTSVYLSLPFKLVDDVLVSTAAVCSSARQHS